MDWFATAVFTWPPYRAEAKTGMVHIMLNPLFTCYNPSRTEITPQPATWKYGSSLVKERKTATKTKVWDEGARHLHNPELLLRQNNRSEFKSVNRNVAGVACCMAKHGFPSLFPDLDSGVYHVSTHSMCASAAAEGVLLDIYNANESFRRWERMQHKHYNFLCTRSQTHGARVL